jgi:hypothetical protein
VRARARVGGGEGMIGWSREGELAAGRVLCKAAQLPLPVESCPVIHSNDRTISADRSKQVTRVEYNLAYFLTRDPKRNSKFSEEMLTLHSSTDCSLHGKAIRKYTLKYTHFALSICLQLVHNLNASIYSDVTTRFSSNVMFVMFSIQNNL